MNHSHYIIKFDPEEIDELSTALGKNLAVKVTGLGIFSIYRHPARETTHPRTKELIRVPAHIRIVFRASKSLKRMLQKK